MQRTSRRKNKPKPMATGVYAVLWTFQFLVLYKFPNERNISGKYLLHLPKKKYTKLIKCNLKLITLINNMQLFLDSTQSNLNFEPSFVAILQVLREIWLFGHEFQARNFDQI